MTSPLPLDAATAAATAAATTSDGWVAVVGFGSLLSRRSAMSTFPSLRNWRLGRVPGYRRTFRHAAAVFFERGIANLETREFSSLSAEPLPEVTHEGVPEPAAADRSGKVLDKDGSGSATDGAAAGGIIVTLFELPASEIPAFFEREEEFTIECVPFEEAGPAGEVEAERAGAQWGESGDGGAVASAGGASSGAGGGSDIAGGSRSASASASASSSGSSSAAAPAASAPPVKAGLMCLASSDEHYLRVRGKEAFEALYSSRGLHTIWAWDRILPCRVYLRHCVLAAAGLGEHVLSNFKETTFLYDGTTTIGAYLEEHPDIMDEVPPPSLADRYNG